MFQSGDVDFLVATDAIGMGLNLDVDHVAFASDRKFDGYQFRRLTAAEFGQIAGRAGRHMRDGTFGVTSRVDPFEDELVEALETHRFDPVKTVQWRNRDLDFSSARRAEGEPRSAADARRPDQGAAVGRRQRARHRQPRRRDPRARRHAGTRRAALGRLPGPRLPQDRARQPRRTGRRRSSATSPATASSPTTGSPARSPMPTAPTATSTRSPTASPISAPGPLPPTGRNGCVIRSIGRSARAR